MSRYLRVAFFGEGNTDSRVIPIFIEKVIQALELTDDISLNVTTQRWNGRGPFLEACVTLVQKAQPLHQLIVLHTDADGPDERRAWRQKVEPILSALQAAQLGEFPLVWAIPVHAIEAWLLASPQAFARALTNDPSRVRELALPRRSDQIHREAAKQHVAEAVYTLLARGQRRRARINPPDYYEAIASELELADLRHLPAFAAFEKRLTEALLALGYVSP